MLVSKKPKTYPASYSLIWSMFFGLLFLAFGIGFMLFPYGLDIFNIDIPSISFYEFTILALAIQRLTRLFVYDSIMHFVRDLFLDLKEVKQDGEIYIERHKPTTHVRRLMYELIACPWCTSVWMSLFVIGSYFVFPILNLLWLILAASSVATFIQISINKIGWQAENAKNECIRKQ